MVLILDGNGEEVDRIVRYNNDPDQYVQKLDNFIKGKNTMRTIEERYKNNKNDLNTVYKLAKAYYDRLRFKEAIKYFEILLNNPGKSKELKFKDKSNINLYSEAKKYMKRLEMFRNNN